jgi:tRNA/tmRNA/rRNA uracil-C5-methylase (TrmA/RlmC/RlmD family)
MQVKELIEMLGYMDQEADVHFAYNYGDHWRTQVAPKVDSVGERVVEYSSYHSMDKIIDADDEDCYDEETGDYKADVRKVVVLG